MTSLLNNKNICFQLCGVLRHRRSFPVFIPMTNLNNVPYLKLPGSPEKSRNVARNEARDILNITRLENTQHMKGYLSGFMSDFGI